MYTKTKKEVLDFSNAKRLLCYDETPRDFLFFIKLEDRPRRIFDVSIIIFYHEDKKTHYFARLLGIALIFE